MEITLVKSKQRLTKSLVRQMPLGYKALCGDHKALGYVVNIISGEVKTAIIEADGEYYTLPLDYTLSKTQTSCIRKVKGHPIEVKFSTIGSSVCRNEWWLKYCTMRNTALKTHIYIC